MSDRGYNIAYNRAYNIGYKEGYLAGILKADIRVSKSFVQEKITNNYEEIIRFFQFSEEEAARIMDYLTVRKENWAYLSDEEWDKRVGDFIERMRRA